MALPHHRPLINGKAYDWNTVIVQMNNANIPFSAIDQISYSDSMEIEDNYGAGAFPVSRGYGNYAAEGSITLHADEIVQLQGSSPTGRLMDIPEFNIIVVYAHPDAAKFTQDILKNVKFMDNGRELNQNDKYFPNEISLRIAWIDWGARGFNAVKNR